MNNFKPMYDGELTQAQCQDCALIHDIDDLVGITYPHMKLMAGDPMPAGQCPNCGALANLYSELNEYTVTLEYTNDGGGTYMTSSEAPDAETAIRYAQEECRADNDFDDDSEDLPVISCVLGAHNDLA